MKGREKILNILVPVLFGELKHTIRRKRSTKTENQNYKKKRHWNLLFCMLVWISDDDLLPNAKVLSTNTTLKPLIFIYFSRFDVSLSVNKLKQINTKKLNFGNM